MIWVGYCYPRLRLNINLPVILRLGFRVRKATQFEWGWPSQYLAKLEYFRILIFYSVSYRKRLGEEDNWKRNAHIQAEVSLSLRLLSFLFPFSDQSTLTSNGERTILRGCPYTHNVSAMTVSYSKFFIQ